MDARLKLGSVCVVAGPSQCGKTCFTSKLIKHRKELFNPIPRDIYWFYGEIIPTAKYKQVRYIKGLPDETYAFNQSLVILDDLFMEIKNSEYITNLFSRIAHHRETFVVFITQNLYHQSSFNRTRMLNTNYLVLFKNIRDNTIIDTLSRQMYPGTPDFLRQVFTDITKNNPYGYLFIDLRVETPDHMRIRSSIFFDPEFIIYKQNTQL